ncbi:sugar MFS transporter [Pseudoduganella umbonata]|uniref:Glucose/galactose transporter n=1 Tax=Pseudoduganella umbonata TaxID=864828 RepID=A0A4P8HLX9_9BURK|nr:sugar MFS transporter [Pseudoduganella umbonata]MBB3225186.1 glucose/galactose transporter [Pseudoduganella umbonata]QCP09288.1 sugar MFS transporter [Pseudoduganella umbonata]
MSIDTAGGPARHSTREVVAGMLFVGLLFFILGFVTWLNGSLVPFLKIVCDLNNFQALWVTFAFYIAYTVMALPSAAVLRRTGYKRGMTIGLGIMGIGALLFIPAAHSTRYELFLAALFALATGMTLMQTAINPYIVCLGPRDSAAMRISIMGLFNKGAGVVVPLIFTSLMLADIDRFSHASLATLEPAARAAMRAGLAQRLVFPYACMAALLFAIMVFIHFSRLRDIAPEEDAPDAQAGQGAQVAKTGVLQFPQLVLGALALFAYVGVEVIAGDTIGLYGHELGVANFGVLTSYTMVCMVLGYLVGAVAIPRWLSQQRALLLSALAGIVFTIGVVTGSTRDGAIAAALLGWTGIAPVPDTVMCLALLGMANAMVWPAIWPLALQGLGRYTASGSALLIMAICGGAVLPLLYGHLSDLATPRAAYWLLLPCYLMILWYAVSGHKLRSWRRTE